MGNPFTAPSISGYNSNPPPDDGSTGANNEVDWSMVKEKIGDPIKTLAEANVTATNTAIGKLMGGNGVTSTAVDYTVLSSDQGKLVRATASGVTITTPDATNVLSPFVFSLLNNSSSTITFDGSGSQTIDGNASLTIPAGTGLTAFTDGSNWFTTGIQGVLVGKQMQYGELINATISRSETSNAVTFSLKTLAGSDPSANDQVLICFRDVTSGTGDYVYRTITAAKSLTISSGSKLGTSDATAFRIWLVLFDDAGTIRLGAINCLNGINIYPLGRTPLASSTAEGGAGGADSAHVFYTGTAVTSKPYVVLGYATYESGLTTAGSWNAAPSTIQLFGHGVRLPGDTIQEQVNFDGAVATGTTLIPNDNTTPQSTEGDQYMSQAITPVSAANILDIDMILCLGNSVITGMNIAVFQDSGTDAIACMEHTIPNASGAFGLPLRYRKLAGTTSATTFKIRAGGNNAGTTTFNGLGGSAKFNGTIASHIKVAERMA